MDCEDHMHWNWLQSCVYCSDLFARDICDVCTNSTSNHNCLCSFDSVAWYSSWMDSALIIICNLEGYSSSFMSLQDIPLGHMKKSICKYTDFEFLPSSWWFANMSLPSITVQTLDVHFWTLGNVNHPRDENYHEWNLLQMSWDSSTRTLKIMLIIVSSLADYQFEVPCFSLVSLIHSFIQIKNKILPNYNWILNYSASTSILQLWRILIVPIQSLHDSKSTTLLPKHGPQILCKQLWFLVRHKVPASLIVTLIHDRTECSCPSSRYDSELFGVEGCQRKGYYLGRWRLGGMNENWERLTKTQGNVIDPFRKSFARNDLIRTRMSRLVIYPVGSTRAGCAEDVYTDPSKDFLVLPLIVVCPICGSKSAICIHDQLVNCAYHVISHKSKLADQQGCHRTSTIRSEAW